MLLLCATTAAPVASAIEPVPDRSGWHGFVLVGAGYLDLKSSMVAGNDLIDIGKRTIASINDGAQSDSVVHPLVTGEINYTFGDHWQAFLGTSLEDFVTLDGVEQLGLRKQAPGVGILQGAFLFSGIPSRVWEDPYQEGVPRHDTDRKSTGMRFQWDRILGSAVELTFTYRAIRIDTERSGQGVTSVTCDSVCQGLLRRDGDQYSVAASYLFMPGDGRRHLLRPMVRYTMNDRDGAAVSSDGYRFQLTYSFIGDGYTFVGNVAAGSTSQDEPNPLYGVRTDADQFAVDASLFYRLPAASRRWQAVAGIRWGEDNSTVDFHDNEVFGVTLAVMYLFGTPPSSRQ